MMNNKWVYVVMIYGYDEAYVCSTKKRALDTIKILKQSEYPDAYDSYFYYVRTKIDDYL